jgi:integrase
MVELQLHSGMRPGEVVIMRACDLDTAGPVWFYKPSHHKTAHRGHGRVVPLGPKCQAITKRFLRPELEAFLFSPARDREERFAELRAKRKTRVQPSQINRRRKSAKRLPKERWTVCSYGRAIARACELANVPHWHPHQLRHSKATEIRRAAGIDAARAVLGHRSPAVTEVYAEVDLNKATEIMARIG